MATLFAYALFFVVGFAVIVGLSERRPSVLPKEPVAMKGDPGTLLTVHAKDGTVLHEYRVTYRVTLDSILNRWRGDISIKIDVEAWKAWEAKMRHTVETDVRRPDELEVDVDGATVFGITITPHQVRTEEITVQLSEITEVEVDILAGDLVLVTTRGRKVLDTDRNEYHAKELNWLADAIRTAAADRGDRSDVPEELRRLKTKS